MSITIKLSKYADPRVPQVSFVQYNEKCFLVEYEELEAFLNDRAMLTAKLEELEPKGTK